MYDHIHQICWDDAFNTFLSERFPPSTKRSTHGVIYVEFGLWSIKIKHVNYVAKPFIIIVIILLLWKVILLQVCLAMLQ